MLNGAGEVTNETLGGDDLAIQIDGDVRVGLHAVDQLVEHEPGILGTYPAIAGRCGVDAAQVSPQLSPFFYQDNRETAIRQVECSSHPGGPTAHDQGYLTVGYLGDRSGTQ